MKLTPIVPNSIFIINDRLFTRSSLTKWQWTTVAPPTGRTILHNNTGTGIKQRAQPLFVFLA